MTADAAATGRTAPHDIALPRGTVGRLRRLAVLAGAAVGDAVNFAGALGAVAATLTEWQVYGAIGALTLATVGLMHYAGVSARKRKLAGLGWQSLGPVVALGALWLAMGLSTFALRLFDETEAAGLPMPGVVPAASTGPTALQISLALLMLTLFLATGGMAAWSAYNGHDPEHDRLVGLRRARRWIRFRAALRARRIARRDRRLLRRERRKLRREARRERRRLRREQRRAARPLRLHRRAGRHVLAALRSAIVTAASRRATRRQQQRLRAAQAAESAAHERLTQAEAAYAEVVDLPARRRADAERDDERYSAAGAATTAWADELRDHARLRLAAALSDPGTTTTLTAPQLPRPVISREDAS